MNIDPANNAMTPWEAKVIRSEEAILESAKRGESITEQAAAGGIEPEAHWCRRRDDPVFLQRWLEATAIGNERRLHEAQTRRAKRFKRVSAIVKQKTDAIEKARETDPEAFDAALRAQLGEDPADFMSKVIKDEVEADKLDGRASGLDAKPTTVNATQVNVGVAVGGAAPADNTPSPDLDGFLSRDLGLSGERDYRQDDARGIWRRVVWVARQAFRTEVKRVVLCIGKGSGKTVVLSLVLARKLQLALHARGYGRRRMGVINLSASGADQAEMAAFTKLTGLVKDSPWFRAYGDPSKSTQDHVEWTMPDDARVCAHSGNSRSENVEGIDWEAAGADEVCRLPEKDNSRILSADGLVGPVEDTMVSRFGGTYKLVIASWPEHRNDYLLSTKKKDAPGQIEMARRTGIRENLTASFLGEPLTWKGGDAEIARREALGKPPFAGFPVEAFLANDGTLVVRCPMWEMCPNVDIETLVQSHARDEASFAARFGAAPVVSGANPYLRDVAAIRARANSAMRSPFDDAGQIRADWQPDPSALYYGHLDGGLGKTDGDAAGLALAHWADGRVVVDMMLEVRAPKGSELVLEDLVLTFKAFQTRGCAIAKVTIDGWQGIAIQQRFQAHGIEAEYFSVDRDRRAYDTWRDAVIQGERGSVDFYAYEPFFECLESLVTVGTKRVDHRADGKKDASDAVVAACYHVIEAMGEYAGIPLAPAAPETPKEEERT